MQLSFGELDCECVHRSHGTTANQLVAIKLSVKAALDAARRLVIAAVSFVPLLAR